MRRHVAGVLDELIDFVRQLLLFSLLLIRLCVLCTLYFVDCTVYSQYAHRWHLIKESTFHTIYYPVFFTLLRSRHKPHSFTRRAYNRMENKCFVIVPVTNGLEDILKFFRNGYGYNL